MVALKEKIEMLRSGKLSPSENVKGFLEAIKKGNKKINAFIDIREELALKEADFIGKNKKKFMDKPLYGLCFGIKANINVKDYEISCASKTLEGHYGAYDADVVKKIKEAGGIVIGITNCDEFACGSSGETSAFGATDNPAAPGLIPGGSSAGSAAAVAAGMCDIALGTDTGGSIRNPASHCGVIGIKPSYGRVSRYGLIDMAMSLEGAGVFSSEVYGSALALREIAGKSRYDATTFDREVPDYVSEIRKPVEGLKIGLSGDFEELCSDKRIYSLIEKSAKSLAEETKSKTKNVKLKYVDLAIQTYYPIVYVEFFSATRKFDGRRLGKKIEESCGEEVLRRILGGKEISKAEYHGMYYRKALQARNLIARDFEEAFNEIDVIIMPTTPKLPHKIGSRITDPRIMYAYDAFTIPANLAGICGGVINAGKIDNIPVGMQILAPAFKEDVLLRVMKAWEGVK